MRIMADLLQSGRESKLAARLRRAIGAGPDDPVNIVTPQFEREAGAPIPACAPCDWESLRTMSYLALCEMGLRPWDELDASGGVLLLFPGEWYHAIPAGFEIVDINLCRKRFVPGETDDDMRFGCLAYGILAGKGTPNG